MLFSDGLHGHYHAGHWLYDALDRLAVFNSELEQRVESRTQQLAQANAELIAEAKGREGAEACATHIRCRRSANSRAVLRMISTMTAIIIT
jgi:phosphoglycerate-specific signal transduction histidine kinase